VKWVDEIRAESLPRRAGLLITMLLLTAGIVFLIIGPTLVGSVLNLLGVANNLAMVSNASIYRRPQQR
jgi:hypothetical protein